MTEEETKDGVAPEMGAEEVEPTTGDVMEDGVKEEGAEDAV